MNLTLVGLCFLMVGVQSPGTPQKSIDQPAATAATKAQQDVIGLSKQKWQLMADRNVEAAARSTCCRCPTGRS